MPTPALPTRGGSRSGSACGAMWSMRLRSAIAYADTGPSHSGWVAVQWWTPSGSIGSMVRAIGAIVEDRPSRLSGVKGRQRLRSRGLDTVQPRPRAEPLELRASRRDEPLSFLARLEELRLLQAGDRRPE